MIKCKRIISIAMLLVMMATMFSVDVFAWVCTPSDTDNQKSRYKCSFNEETGELVISGRGPFVVCEWNDTYKKQVKSVKIEKGMTLIGENAFADFTNLKEITIPNSVKEIGESAFDSCTALTSITIPDGVTRIGVCAFANCKSLKEITIPDSVTHMGSSAVAYCENLEHVTISNSLPVINEYAFAFCESLQEITIPNSVTEINNDAFSECKSLKSVTYLGKRDPFVDLYEEEFEEDDENPVFDNCPIKKVKVPIDYEGDTFCGIKVTKEWELFL